MYKKKGVRIKFTKVRYNGKVYYLKKGHNMKFDVIIVGAGPAGLQLAKELITSSLKVLIIDKNETVGPKVCAGGLTNKDINFMDIPSHIIEHSYNSMNLHISNKKYAIKRDATFIYTVNRETFGQWQLTELNSPNITLWKNCKVCKINDHENSIETSTGKKVYYSYLVGADGSASIVRNHLGLKNSRSIVAFQYLVKTDEHYELEFYLDSKKFGPTYVWIFPHKGFISVGTGCFPKYYSHKKLQQNFEEWFQTQPFSSCEKKFEVFPINCDFQGYQFGNIFLVGDAAGLASDISGEGIYQALVSGSEVAKLILNPNYVPTELNYLIKRKKLYRLLLKLPIILGPFRTTLFKLTAKKLQKGRLIR